METLLEAIGNTPLLKLAERTSAGAAIYAKLERFNPGVSIKDRHVLAMIEAAESQGVLKPGGTVIEAVYGNTGIALAHICNIKGYQLILVMPEDYIPERRHVLSCLGIEIINTPAAQGIRGAMEQAAAIKVEHPDYFTLNHFDNAAQLTAHLSGLAQEILDDLTGIQIDAFVGALGTGSSLAALAQVLRPQGTQIIAVEPEAGQAIPGIGFGLEPQHIKAELVDRIVTVTAQDAARGFKELAAENGVLAGLSCGANYRVAKQIAAELGPGKNVLTIFYDGGERYFSLQQELKEKAS